MSRDYAQRHIFAARTNQDRRMRLLGRLRIEARIAQLMIAPAEVRTLLGPQPLDDLERFFEPAQSPAGSVKRNAVFLMLLLEPPRADPQDKTAAADDIHRGLPSSPTPPDGDRCCPSPSGRAAPSSSQSRARSARSILRGKARWGRRKSAEND